MKCSVCGSKDVTYIGRIKLCTKCSVIRTKYIKTKARLREYERQLNVR